MPNFFAYFLIIFFILINYPSFAENTEDKIAENIEEKIKYVVGKPYKIKGMGGPQKSVAEKKKVKAKKAADKSWKEATGKQKKEGKKGVTLSSLIAKRKGLTKGTSAYASIQNQINKAYVVKKRHTATTKTKTTPKPQLKAKPDATAEA